MKVILSGGWRQK